MNETTIAVFCGSRPATAEIAKSILKIDSDPVHLLDTLLKPF